MQKMYIDDDICEYITKNLPVNSRIGMDYSLFSEAKATQIMMKLRGYDFIDETDSWISDRQLDEFINKNLLLDRLERINGMLS